MVGRGGPEKRVAAGMGATVAGRATDAALEKGQTAAWEKDRVCCGPDTWGEADWVAAAREAAEARADEGAAVGGWAVAAAWAVGALAEGVREA